MRRASLKSGALKPHRIRYWLTPAPDEELWPKVAEINTVYHEATARAARDERTVSTDEMTGVQALERKHPGLPLVPGKVERREFEYMRHGTRAFILSRDVVSGRVVAPSVGPTRTEADFLVHLQGVVATDPTATRAAFLNDPTHRIVFHYTPKHASWMNQIEQWFGILRRKRLRSPNFADLPALQRAIHQIIAEWNEIAHPFRWTPRSFEKIRAKVDAALAADTPTLALAA